MPLKLLVFVIFIVYLAEMAIVTQSHIDNL